MAMKSKKANKFDIRWSDEQQALIRQAASIRHMNPTTFIRENAVQAAQQVLEDQVRFVLTEEQWNAVNKALSAPARNLPNLKELLSHEDAWDGKTVDS